MKKIIALLLIVCLVVSLFTIIVTDDAALAAEGSSAFLIYKDGATETAPVPVSGEAGKELAVQLPVTAAAAGLSNKTGFRLDAWVGTDAAEYAPGETITLTDGSTTTLTAKWSLVPPTVRVIELGTDVEYNPSTGTYTATYGVWSSSKPWAFQFAVTHPLQTQAALKCYLYHNGDNIHTSVTNWWGNNRNPSATSDDLACSMNAVSDSGSYWFVAEYNGYTSQPSEIKTFKINPATLTISAKPQNIDVSEALDTVPSNSTISLSTNKVSVDEVAATGAVSLERGTSLGNGRYQIRVVIEDKDALPNYVMKAGSTGTLTMTGTPTIVLSDQTVGYTGLAVVPDPSNVVITGHDVLGTPPNASDVTYKYFSDESCTAEIDSPINKGTYYIKAYTGAKNAYLAGESNVATITIGKATLTVTPKSWTVPEGATLEGIPVELLIAGLQTDGIVLGSDFDDWVDWAPQNTGIDTEIESFLSGSNLVLKLGELDTSASPIKKYPITIDYVDEDEGTVTEFKENFDVELNDENSVLTINPIPSLEWIGEAADGVINVEYTGYKVNLSDDEYFIVTDGGTPAIEAPDGDKGYEYYLTIDLSGDGATESAKAQMQENLNIVFGEPIPFTPTLPADVFLGVLADEAKIDLTALAEKNIFPIIKYYAVPIYENGSVFADAAGSPVELNIVPRVVKVVAREQNLFCTDPLLELINGVLIQAGEFELDETTFDIAARVTTGTLNEELEDAIRSGYLCIKLGEKTPADAEHSYTQPIIIDYSSRVSDEIKAMLPLLYDIDLKPGTLTVSPHTIELSWSNTENRIYGDGKTVTAEITAGVDDNAPNVTVIVEDGDRTEVGTYTAKATLQGDDAVHYIINPEHLTKEYTITSDTPPIINIHSCNSNCSVCGGCKDITCCYSTCKNKCVLMGMNFTDLTDGTWYTEAATHAYHHGIMNGIGNNKFDPNGTTSRAMIVTFLWRAAGCPEPLASETPFTDIDINSYYGKAVLWAAENGITNGTSATTFSPDADCSRGEMVVFLSRFANAQPTGGSISFSDVDENAYYADAVLWAANNKITNGTGENTFSPDADCSRAETVTFIYRLYNN